MSTPGRFITLEGVDGAEDIDRLRMLFDDLEKKESLSDILNLAETGQGGQQVFGGLDLDLVFVDQHGAQLGLADQMGLGLDLDRGRQVDAAEHDAGVGRGRAQGHEHLFAAMQAHAGGADDILQCALLNHAVILTAHRCMKDKFRPENDIGLLNYQGFTDLL